MVLVGDVGTLLMDDEEAEAAVTVGKVYVLGPDSLVALIGRVANRAPGCVSAWAEREGG